MFRKIQKSGAEVKLLRQGTYPRRPSKGDCSTSNAVAHQVMIAALRRLFPVSLIVTAQVQSSGLISNENGLVSRKSISGFNRVPGG